MAEHPKVFDHVGLLSNQPPDRSRDAFCLVFRRNHEAAVRSMPLLPTTTTLSLMASRGQSNQQSHLLELFDVASARIRELLRRRRKLDSFDLMRCARSKSLDNAWCHPLLHALTSVSGAFIAVVNQELCATIDRLWPEELGTVLADSMKSELSDVPLPDLEEIAPIAAQASGYVDAIDDEGFLQLAQERDLVIKLARRPEHFVVKGSSLAAVYPAAKTDDEVGEIINGSLSARR